MSTWVLILAAGDGNRLRGISRDRMGRPAPKQFGVFGAGRTLLAQTLDRALDIAPAGRIMAIVAEQHSMWWPEELARIPMGNIVVQPENRGTAAGILLPLLHIAARDPEATVIVLPSDHHIGDEATVRRSIGDALVAIAACPGKVVLLGITPDRPDPEYGWILPGAGIRHRPRAVTAFVEKPGTLEAARLQAAGALWNSFMFAGRVTAVLDMFRKRLPGLLTSMQRAVSDAPRSARTADPALGELYRGLETRDFSREILQSTPERLRVIAVPACDWTDLGTPDRLARVFERPAMPAASLAASAA